jgi:hemolysin III
MDRVGTLHQKPLLRGVSHEVASAFALAGGVVLVRAAEGPRAAVGAAVYAAALTGLFGISALYHRPRWGDRARLLLRRIDHAAIFLLIAGTYTPICLLLGERGRALLAAVWAGAAMGVALSIAWPYAPKVLLAALCVALGWAVVPVLPALRAAIGPGGLALLLAGGLAYTAGAVVYAARRPDPFPRVFGYHEIFHALVVVAAVLHYAAVASVVGALS